MKLLTSIAILAAFILTNGAFFQEARATSVRFDPDARYDRSEIVIKARLESIENGMATISPLQVWKGNVSKMPKEYKISDPNCMKWIDSNGEYYLFMRKESVESQEFKYCGSTFTPATNRPIANYLSHYKSKLVILDGKKVSFATPPLSDYQTECEAVGGHLEEGQNKFLRCMTDAVKKGEVIAKKKCQLQHGTWEMYRNVPGCRMNFADGGEPCIDGNKCDGKRCVSAPRIASVCIKSGWRVGCSLIISRNKLDGLCAN